MDFSKNNKKGFSLAQDSDALFNNVLYGVWLLIDIVRFLVVALLYVLKSIVELIIPKREKNVAGQFALVIIN
jgi:hypothetical protein